MKTPNFKAAILLVCSISLCIQARILVVVDNNFYNADYMNKSVVDAYMDDILKIDRKPAELILWNNRAGNVREQCFPLWQRLASEYSLHHHNPTTEDDVEGAVFVGVLPIPMFTHWFTDSNITTHNWDTIWYNFPHDSYFMDIWNSTSNAVYASDLDIFNFRADKGLFETPGYILPLHSPNKHYFDQGNGYHSANGDGRLDIWVSRIMGEFVHQPTDNVHGSWYPANYFVSQHLLRAHNRMSCPASVPARSFSMSGITSPDFGNPYPDDVLQLNQLNLPFHTVFRHPANNPANLQSQLQAGPRGNSNNGAYLLQTTEQSSVLRVPAGWSTRNCMYSSLLNITTGAIQTNLDTLGYEWAGVYEHGDFPGMGMNGSHFAGSGAFKDMNGHFRNYSCALPVTNSFLANDANGYLGSYLKFRTQDVWNSTVPGFPSIWDWDANWQDLSGVWQLHPPIPGAYDVYVYYVAQSNNNSAITVRIDQLPVNNFGVVNDVASFTLNETAHTNEEVFGNRWERIGRVALNSSFSYNDGGTILTYNTDVTTITMDLNGNAVPGYFMLDAVKIVGVNGTSTQGQSVIVDNNSVDFSMVSPGKNRSYLECSVDGGTPKTQFFLANSCHLNEYTGTTVNGANNLGMLFAMLYNGLISMGTSNSNYVGYSYSAFVSALRTGSDFGQALLAQANINGDPEFCLLGAGNLKATAYIPYGAQMLTDVTVSSSVNSDYSVPVYMKNYIVTSTGIANVGAAREIHIVPESAFRAGSNVHLYVH